MELKVEEDLEPEFLELANDLRALSIKERHADLDPTGMALQVVTQLKGTLLIAIERDDDALACSRL